MLWWLYQWWLELLLEPCYQRPSQPWLFLFVCSLGGPGASRWKVLWGWVVRVHPPKHCGEMFVDNPQNLCISRWWLKKSMFYFHPCCDSKWLTSIFFQMDWFSGAKVVRGFTGIHWVSSEGGGVGSQVVVVEDPWDEQLYFYSMNGWSVQ